MLLQLGIDFSMDPLDPKDFPDLKSSPAPASSTGAVSFQNLNTKAVLEGINHQPRKKKKRVMLPAPHNIQEFVDIGWVQHIRLRIRTFNLRDCLNREEDLVNDILISLMETKYLDRYDENKGSFVTFLYGYIDNFLRKRYNKEHTRYGQFIVNRASLEISSSNESDLDFTKCYLDLLLDKKSLDQDFGLSKAETSVYIQNMRDCLQKRRDLLEKQGLVGKKGDFLTVFDLLLQGKDTLEIATIMGTSRQFVYYLSKRMRQILQEEGFSYKLPN